MDKSADKKQEIIEHFFSVMRQGKDFPVMSSTVELINKFKSTSAGTVDEFANLILKDYSLTAKILKIVNSVSYAQFGEVTTISRAIILLGFENVRNLAFTLMLFDNLQKNEAHTEIIDTIVKSFYSGILAQKIVTEIEFAHKEEAFICSLLHSFGKLMLAYYMPDVMKQIKAKMAEENISEALAVLSVFGVSYEDLGTAIAQAWNLPTKIIQSMQNIRPSEMPINPTEIQRLTAVATFVTNVADILSAPEDTDKKYKNLDKLFGAYKSYFKPIESKFRGFVSSSLNELLDYSSFIKLDFKNVPFTQRMLGFGISTTTATKTAKKPEQYTDSLQPVDSIFAKESSSEGETPDSIFTKGIQDVNNSIVNNYSLNDTLRIVLETMYRGLATLGGSKVLFLLKDPKQPQMIVRFGFGENLEEIKRWFKIDLSETAQDIFNIAINKQSDFVIKDLTASDIKARLPQWFSQKVKDSAFVLLMPITVNRKVLAFFYIEGQRDKISNLSPSVLNYLKIMRDQTVLAIKQKQGY